MKIFFASTLLSLLLLSPFAEAVPGTILTEEEYGSAYSTLYRNSQYHDQIVEEIVKRRMNGTLAGDSLFDVGAGPGKLTCMLKPYFQKIVTLDPNAMFCEQHAQEGFHAIQGTFEETALQERFDLVLCSHVLYYSDPSEWNSFVEKLTRHRKPGGVVAIAMMSPLGEDAELVKRFRPNFKVHSGTLETLPVIQQSRKEVIHSHHEYVVDTYEEMLTLCRFLISEDAFTPEEYWSLTDKRREEIDALIRSEVDRMKRADGKFVMQWEQDLYLLRS